MTEREHDRNFLQAMTIQPCDVTRPIPNEWTDRGLRKAAKAALEVVEHQPDVMRKYEHVISQLGWEVRLWRAFALCGWCVAVYAAWQATR